MKELLEKYTEYNLWANTKLIGFLKNLDLPLIDKELISSFKTIRLTLYHMWDAEILWYNRLHGKSLSNWPSKGFHGTIDEFYKLFLDQSAKFADYTKSAAEKNLKENFSYQSTEGEKYTNRQNDIILHCMNHSTFHRGQIITMIRNTGFTDLSSTDYITFIREHKI